MFQFVEAVIRLFKALIRLFKGHASYLVSMDFL